MRDFSDKAWLQAQVEETRAMGMLMGAIAWSIFVLVCALIGIAAADWWTDGTAFIDSVPPAVQCLSGRA